MKVNKQAVIRARCTNDLKRKIQWVAQLQEVDEADVLRIACKHYVEKFKQPEALLHG